MTPQQLKNIGFKEVSYIEHGEQFNEFLYKRGKTEITVYTNKTIELLYEGDYIDVPNCKTIEDMKYLIKLFTV